MCMHNLNSMVAKNGKCSSSILKALVKELQVVGTQVLHNDLSIDNSHFLNISFDYQS